MENVQEVGTKALTVVERANGLLITDATTYRKAGDLYVDCRAMMKEVDGTFDPIISKAFQAHKEAKAQKDKFWKPLDETARFVKSIMSSYDIEQERIRKAEEARLQKEAEEIAAAEKKAELDRIEEERKAEDERLLALAIQEEKAGNYKTAADLLQVAEKKEKEAIEEMVAVAAAPVFTAPVVVPKAVPKMAGVSFRETWSAEIVNIRELCFSVANGQVSTELVTGNMPALNKLAGAMKSTFNIPGVRAVSRRS